jgi:hypothetical protein
MALFGRDKPEVPRIDVNGDEATVSPDQEKNSEEHDPRMSETPDPRRVRLPKTKWYAPRT